MSTLRSMPARVFWAALLVLGVGLAFGGLASNGFILLDDTFYVTRNPMVAQGLTWDGLEWACTTTTQSNWHPLTWLSHMLDVELFGLEPAGHHLVSLALHTASSVLLFALFLRWSAALVPSFLAAAFFAWHPLRVESVAWAAERKDVLSLFFLLLALHAWTDWAREQRRGAFVWTHVWFALGLLAKPMLVTLPFLLLLLDLWPFARWSLGTRRLLREKTGLLALAFASSVVTYLAQSSGGAVISQELLGFGQRLANAVVAYGTYLRQTVWPVELSVFYPHPHATPWAELAVALTVLALISGLVLRRARKEPGLAVSWLWYLGTLVPVIGLVQVGGQAHADRYSYLPAIGLSIAVLLGAQALLSAGTPRALLLGGAGLALALLGLRTRAQVALWKDTRTLFEHALAVTPESALVRQNLGNAYFEAHEPERALAELEACARLDARFPDLQNNLGSVLILLGRTDEAIACFQTALAQGQDDVRVRANLGLAYFKQRRLPEAVAEYERALAHDPDHFQSQTKLGTVLGMLGRPADALVHLERARELDYTDVENNRALGLTCMLLGREAQAIGAYSNALERAPEDLESLKSLAWLRSMAREPLLRDARVALQLAEHAARLAGQGDSRAQDVLSAARAESGDFTGATQAAERALELYRAQNRAGAVEQVTKRLAAYRQGQTYHEP